MTPPYETVEYFAMALDPIHIGTGGYRLGRVDLSIVREPGTNLPKIPGTSLSGATRAYAAMATGRYSRVETVRKSDGTDVQARGSCAGQGQGGEGELGHCGSPYCPVCVAFGFARGGTGGFQGLAQFADARVLFFPVHSAVGPVWMTCPMALSDHGITVTVSPDRVKLRSGLSAPNQRLNLGWLMMQSEGNFQLSQNQLQKVPDGVKQRAVLVSDELFSQVVNDNLEVRTSVSIDPATGAAEEGALFTYEALPRSTVFWFPITYSDPQLFRIRYNGQLVPPEPRQNASSTGASLTIKSVAEKGLAALEHLGIGGMNTRGMGRLKVLSLSPSAAINVRPGQAVSHPSGVAS